MTASSGKAIVLPKNVPELDPTNGKYSPLNYSRSRIELASVLANHNFILKDTLYREQLGRAWKWVILICFDSKPFLTCLWELFSLHEWLSTISSPSITSSSIHLLFFPLLKIERKHEGNGSLDSKGSWSWCKGDVEVPFRSWLFSFLPVLV